MDVKILGKESEMYISKQGLTNEQLDTTNEIGET